MSKAKITPQVVKTIESALEERKKTSDRRRDSKDYAGVERRSGADRREKS